jgi:tetratricopeptide (TPR) repeat protein
VAQPYRANHDGDVDADLRSLLDLYEARGDEDTYAQAKPDYEQAIADAPDAELIRDYGYLLECHGRLALRRAVEQYERALTLDPEADKVRYQMISARAALGEIDEEISYYTVRLAAAPDDLRQYRYLARAYLAAREYERAREVIDAGLALAGQDRVLIECRGDLWAAAGDTSGALADWRRALELDPEDISPLYSSAFMYEREGRYHDAIAAWEAIRGWALAREDHLDAEWPERERERLLRRLHDNGAAAAET